MAFTTVALIALAVVSAVSGQLLPPCGCNGVGLLGGLNPAALSLAGLNPAALSLGVLNPAVLSLGALNPAALSLAPTLPGLIPSCGPPPTPLPPLTFRDTAPLQQAPTIALPSPPIPAPQCVSNICKCQKTVVKPQVFRKITTVPSIQKLLQTGYTPVSQQINYSAKPCCGESSLGLGALGLSAAPALNLGLGLSAAPALNLGFGLAAAPALNLGFGLNAAALGLAAPCGC